VNADHSRRFIADGAETVRHLRWDNNDLADTGNGFFPSTVNYRVDRAGEDSTLAV
jgi:hypothetical protein